MVHPYRFNLPVKTLGARATDVAGACTVLIVQLFTLGIFTSVSVALVSRTSIQVRAVVPDGTAVALLLVHRLALEVLVKAYWTLAFGFVAVWKVN